MRRSWVRPPWVSLRKRMTSKALSSKTFEFIPIYGPRCLRGKEAPALAGGPCTGLRSCPPAFLALIRVTVDALPCLVPPCEAAVPAQKACCDALHHCRMHLPLWSLIG